MFTLLLTSLALAQTPNPDGELRATTELPDAGELRPLLIDLGFNTGEYPGSLRLGLRAPKLALGLTADLAGGYSSASGGFFNGAAGLEFNPVKACFSSDFGCVETLVSAGLWGDFDASQETQWGTYYGVGLRYRPGGMDGRFAVDLTTRFRTQLGPNHVSAPPQTGITMTWRLGGKKD